jgi:hypothetical protein
MSHQEVEPRNTPRMRAKALVYVAFAVERPRPAKIAIKASMVIGLVSVRKNVEA